MSEYPHVEAAPAVEDTIMEKREPEMAQTEIGEMSTKMLNEDARRGTEAEHALTL